MLGDEICLSVCEIAHRNALYSQTKLAAAHGTQCHNLVLGVESWGCSLEHWGGVQHDTGVQDTTSKRMSNTEVTHVMCGGLRCAYLPNGAASLAAKDTVVHHQVRGALQVKWCAQRNSVIVERHICLHASRMT